MSIFPHRVRPGGQVVVHLRIHAGEYAKPVLVHYRTFAVGPKGRKISIARGKVLAMPEPKGGPTGRSWNITRRILRQPPLALASEYLRRGFADVNQAEQFFRECEMSTHIFRVVKIPRSLPLGKYKVVTEFRVQGRVSGSRTQRSDFFFVEDLKLSRVRNVGRWNTAEVRNLSSEPVPAELYSSAGVRAVLLKARATAKLKFKGTDAFLRYGSSGEILYL